MNKDPFHSHFFEGENWEIISQKFNSFGPNEFFCTDARWTGPIPKSTDGQPLWSVKTQSLFSCITLVTPLHRLRLCNFGAATVSWEIKMPSGQWRDIVLGFANQESYFTNTAYFGVAVGPCSNRVETGSYVYLEKKYQLCLNEGNNHLHGGHLGFHKKIWDIDKIELVPKGILVQMSTQKQQFEDGYPDSSLTRLSFWLGPTDFTTAFEVSAMGPMPVSPTLHHYFNLSGESNVSKHSLMLNATHMMCNPRIAGTPPDNKVTGKSRVPLSAFQNFGPEINLASAIAAGGLDHNYFLEPGSLDLNLAQNPLCQSLNLHLAATLAVSDLCLTVSTNLPCIQIYTFNDLNAAYQGKGGQVYGTHKGICLETQYAPGAVQTSEWASPILLKGKRGVYVTQTKFETK